MISVPAELILSNLQCRPKSFFRVILATSLCFSRPKMNLAFIDSNFTLINRAVSVFRYFEQLRTAQKTTLDLGKFEICADSVSYVFAVTGCRMTKASAAFFVYV